MFRKKLVMNVKFKYMNHRSSRMKLLYKKYVACSEKHSYLCEVQSLLPQKFNNTTVRNFLSVTLLVCPTTNCEVQALVPQKFSNTAVRKKYM